MLTAIILGLLLGNLIAKAVRRFTQKRRAADLNKLTAIAAGIGGARFRFYNISWGFSG